MKKTPQKKAKGKKKNRLGLARDIPSEVARRIRQECFFGCVICGSMPYQYDHFDPPFAECKEHIASGIALLCANCHIDKTAGRISADQVRLARTSPYGRNHGSRWRMRPGTDIRLIVGSNEVRGPTAFLKTRDGHVIFGIMPDPLSSDVDWLLSASLKDSDGKAIFAIRDNVLKIGKDAWDFELSGNEILIRRKLKQVALRMLIEPVARTITIDSLDMMTDRGTPIRLDSDGCLHIGRGQISGLRASGVGAAIVFDG